MQEYGLESFVDKPEDIELQLTSIKALVKLDVVDKYKSMYSIKDDIETLADHMNSYPTFNYLEFLRMAVNAPGSFQRFFTAENFLKLTKSYDGIISREIFLR